MENDVLLVSLGLTVISRKGKGSRHKGKREKPPPQKAKGKVAEHYNFILIPLHVQKPRVALTHKTKQFPEGGVTGPNLRLWILHRPFYQLRLNRKLHHLRSPWITPHLRNAPLTAKRLPGGQGDTILH